MGNMAPHLTGAMAELWAAGALRTDGAGWGPEEGSLWSGLVGTEPSGHVVVWLLLKVLL